MYRQRRCRHFQATVQPAHNANYIFHGIAGKVSQGEEIYENIDDDSDEFRCPNNFVPIFFDEALAAMDPSLRAEADTVCNNDVTCLFDIAATNNIAIGEETLSGITAINNEIAEIGMSVYLLMIP